MSRRKSRGGLGLGPIIFIVVMVTVIIYLYATGSAGTHF